MSGMARAYGAGHLVLINSALNVPGVTNLSVRMAVGSPAASAAAATLGTSISTTQTRLAISFNAPLSGVSILGIPVTNITFPVYLQIAPGTATVAAIPCQTGGTMATISAEAQAATVQIGSVSSSDLTNFGANPTPTPGGISVNVPIVGSVGVAISGTFPLAAGAPQNLDFTQTDIDNGMSHEAAGSNAGTVFSGVGAPGALTFTITPLGLTLNLGSLTTNIQALLSNLNGPTDLLLRTLGLRLGVMDVTVHGVRCGTPTLVT
jgi:uncharacterized membrane protein